MFTNPQFLFVFYLTPIVLAIAGLFVLRFASRQGKVSSESMHWIVMLGCWVIIVGGMAGLAAISPFGFFSVTLSILVLIIVILIPAGILINVTVRPNYRSEQNALLWSLAIAAEKMIPLAPTIAAFARESTGQMADKARKLARLLESGVPLPEAIDRVPGILPARVLPMIRVGCDSGVLAQSLRQAVSSRDLLTIVWNSLFAKLVYIAMVITFGLGILTFMLIKIVPSYERIFRDFKMDLPVITKALMGVSHFVVDAWFVFSAFILVVYRVGGLLHTLLFGLGVALFQRDVGVLAPQARGDNPGQPGLGGGKQPAAGQQRAHFGGNVSSSGRSPKTELRGRGHPPRPGLVRKPVPARIDQKSRSGGAASGPTGGKSALGHARNGRQQPAAPGLPPQRLGATGISALHNMRGLGRNVHCGGIVLSNDYFGYQVVGGMKRQMARFFCRVRETHRNRSKNGAFHTGVFHAPYCNGGVT